MDLKKRLQEWGFTLPTVLMLFFAASTWASEQGYTMSGAFSAIAYVWAITNAILSEILPLVVALLLSFFLWIRKRKRKDRVMAEWLDILGGNMKATKHSLERKLAEVEEVQEELEKRIDKTEWDWDDFKKSPTANTISEEMYERRRNREVPAP